MNGRVSVESLEWGKGVGNAPILNPLPLAQGDGDDDDDEEEMDLPTRTMVTHKCAIGRKLTWFSKERSISRVDLNPDYRITQSAKVRKGSNNNRLMLMDATKPYTPMISARVVSEQKLRRGRRTFDEMPLLATMLDNAESRRGLGSPRYIVQVDSTERAEAALFPDTAAASSKPKGKSRRGGGGGGGGGGVPKERRAARAIRKGQRPPPPPLVREFGAKPTVLPSEVQSSVIKHYCYYDKPFLRHREQIRKQLLVDTQRKKTDTQKGKGAKAADTTARGILKLSQDVATPSLRRTNGQGGLPFGSFGVLESTITTLASRMRQSGGSGEAMSLASLASCTFNGDIDHTGNVHSRKETDWVAGTRSVKLFMNPAEDEAFGTHVVVTPGHATNGRIFVSELVKLHEDARNTTDSSEHPTKTVVPLRPPRPPSRTRDQAKSMRHVRGGGFMKKENEFAVPVPPNPPPHVTNSNARVISESSRILPGVPPATNHDMHFKPLWPVTQGVSLGPAGFGLISPRRTRQMEDEHSRADWLEKEEVPAPVVIQKPTVLISRCPP